MSFFKHTIAILAVTCITTLSWAQSTYEDIVFQPKENQARNFFGTAVDLSGTIAIAGAPSGRFNSIQSGTAYIFNMQTNEQLHALAPSDGITGCDFGSAVAISDRYAVVGAPKYDGIYTYEGAAYIFDVHTGEELHRLVPIDTIPYSSFGRSVAISGEYILVGCTMTNRPNGGAVFVFDATTGKILHTLSVDGLDNSAGFGFSLDTHGDFAVVGAKIEDSPVHQSGAAYVFNIATGEKIYRLTPEFSRPGQFFGTAVAISDNRVVVSSPDGYVDNYRHGNAYLFDLQSGEFITAFHQFEIDTSGDFGFDIDISENYIIVGARGMRGGGSVSGTAYLFDSATGTQLGQLLNSNPSIHEAMGTAVAIENDNIILGGPNSRSNHEQAGATYSYYAPCPLDLNHDSSLDFNDVFHLIQSQLDWNSDSTFNYFDISLYLQAFRVGCP